jgi:WD40 repeat protein
LPAGCFRFHYHQGKGSTITCAKPPCDTARVFISYSRTDGATFASELRSKLLSKDLSVWQDIVALEGGRDWWTQIEEALRSKALQHFVLIVTPAALGSSVVRHEIRLARQEGKTVSPIRGPGLDELGKLPRWLGQLYDLDLPEHFTALIRVLEDQSRQKRVPMMAPEPPADFVKRLTESESLKKKLCDQKGDMVAISAALKGAGGYGKTTLARALAHDPDIQDAYFDGVLWVELGEKPDNLLGTIADLVTILSGTPPGLETINAAASALGAALGYRRILMIIDDVWREQDLRPFLQGGPNTTRLITTRLSRVLPANAFHQPLDAMTAHEARELLSHGLSADQALSHSRELNDLAARLGEWPQLLKLVNGFLRERVVDAGQPMGEALVDANDRLSEEGLVSFDAGDESDRTKAIARTINLSLGLLDNIQRVRFAELAVFPEDVDVPIGIISLLWKETAGLTESRTKDLLIKLYGLSLILGLDLNQRTLRIHETTRRFLQDQAGKEGLISLHEQLLRLFVDVNAPPQGDELSWRYFCLYRSHHLAQAGDLEAVNKLLLDPGWLMTKLAAAGSAQALVADYERYGTSDLQKFIGRTLRLTARICARDQRQFMPQLLGRLMGCNAPGTADFLKAARRHLWRPAILTYLFSLTGSGAETDRIEGPGGTVYTICALPDGRLASASGIDDTAIRLWDLRSGVETARFEGHRGTVLALCMLPDGRLASGSDDNTIRLWNAETGGETACLVGHSDSVRSLCVLSDGRLASGSEDGSVRLWNVTTGAETARVEHHSSWPNSVHVLPDGRIAHPAIVTVYRIQLCDPKSEAVLANFEVGQGAFPTAVCVLPDGRLATGWSDKGIRFWDPKTGAETTRVEVDEGPPVALYALPDNRVVSSSTSGDYAITVWDPSTATPSARLKGHSKAAVAFCLLPDGRLASCAEDNTIRLWDLEAGVETTRFEGSGGRFHSICLLPDGRIASGLDDTSVRLWDLSSGTEARRLDGHTSAVTALCTLPDGRLASGSNDNTIRLWNTSTGVETACLEIPTLKDHTNPVWSLCVLPDGRLAFGRQWSIRFWDVATGLDSGGIGHHCGWPNSVHVLPDGSLAHLAFSSIRTIQLCDPTTGAVTADFRNEHWGFPTTLCVLPDGRVASGSQDKIIRLWDPKTGAETARIADQGVPQTFCVLPDGRLVSGSAGGERAIRVWDVRTGAENACLKGHSGDVEALCVLSDGRLASCAGDNTIRLWDLAVAGMAERVQGHSRRVTALCMLPDGRLASASNESTIRLWDTSTGVETACLTGDEDGVDALCVWRGGLASAGRGGTLRLWDPHSGKQATPVQYEGRWVRELCALPDGRIAIGTFAKQVFLFDPKSGTEICLIGACAPFCVLPNGRLASASENKTIRIWDLRTDTETGRLQGSANALCLVPDGRLASASEAGIQLWNLVTGMESARFHSEPPSGILNMCVLPDGRLVTGSWDCLVQLWDPRKLGEIARLEVDAHVTCVAAISQTQIAAGDWVGRLYWLEMVD